MKNTYIVEPNIESHSVYKLTDYKEAINKADIVVFLVAHKEFLNLDILMKKYCWIFVVSKNNLKNNAVYV